MAPSPLLSWAFVGVRTLLASFWPSMDENPTDSCAHWLVSCSSSVTEMWPGAAGGHPQPKHRGCAGHLLLTFGRREVFPCLQQAVVVLVVRRGASIHHRLICEGFLAVRAGCTVDPGLIPPREGWLAPRLALLKKLCSGTGKCRDSYFI